MKAGLLMGTHCRLLVGLISHKAEPKKSEEGWLVRIELTMWVLDRRHLDQRNPQIAETIFSRGGNSKIFQMLQGHSSTCRLNQPVTSWENLGIPLGFLQFWNSHKVFWIFLNPFLGHWTSQKSHLKKFRSVIAPADLGEPRRMKKYHFGQWL